MASYSTLAAPAEHGVAGALFGSSRRMCAEPGERGFVDRQRGLGRSWQTIGKMLGRCVVDLRDAYDPGWRAVEAAPPPEQSPLAAPVPVASPPRPAPIRRAQPVQRRAPPSQPKVEPGANLRAVLTTLAKGPLGCGHVARVSGAGPARASSGLNYARARGLATSTGHGRGERGVWSLTPDGRAWLAAQASPSDGA